MKRFFKLIMCIISVCCIFVSVCPISSFAAVDDHNTFSVASDKPIVTDYSGYVELLFEDKYSGLQFVTVLSWYFSPYINESPEDFTVSDKPILRLFKSSDFFRLGVRCDPNVTGNISFISIQSDVVGGAIDLTSASIIGDSEFFYPIDYGDTVALVGMHYYGNFDLVTESGPDEEFYVSYGSDAVISHGLNQVISGIYSLIDLIDDESYKDELDSIISELNSIDSTLSDFRLRWINTMNSLFEQIGLILEDLGTLVENTDEIEAQLDEVITYLISIDNWLLSINDWTMLSYMELYEIHSIVQSILDTLNAQGENGEKLTQPDNSDMDNYYDVENGLLDNGNADINGAVNVQVNQNAMSVIWDLVESALNSHGKVIGMVLTILALGIVALILGR